LLTQTPGANSILRIFHGKKRRCKRFLLVFKGRPKIKYPSAATMVNDGGNKNRELGNPAGPEYAFEIQELLSRWLDAWAAFPHKQSPRSSLVPPPSPRTHVCRSAQFICSREPLQECFCLNKYGISPHYI